MGSYKRCTYVLHSAQQGSGKYVLPAHVYFHVYNPLQLISGRGISTSQAAVLKLLAEAGMNDHNLKAMAEAGLLHRAVQLLTASPLPSDTLRALLQLLQSFSTHVQLLPKLAEEVVSVSLLQACRQAPFALPQENRQTAPNLPAFAPSQGSTGHGLSAGRTDAGARRDAAPEACQDQRSGSDPASAVGSQSPTAPPDRGYPPRLRPEHAEGSTCEPDERPLDERSLEKDLEAVHVGNGARGQAAPQISSRDWGCTGEEEGTSARVHVGSTSPRELGDGACGVGVVPAGTPAAHGDRGLQPAAPRLQFSCPLEALLVFLEQDILPRQPLASAGLCLICC